MSHRWRITWPRSAAAAFVVVVPLALSGCGGSSITPASSGSSSGSASSNTDATTSSDSSTASDAATEPSASASDTAEAISDLAVGKSVTSHGTDDNGKDFQMSVTVRAVKKAKSLQYSTPTNGQYLGVQVTYVCSSGTCRYNPFDWVLRNADGEEMDQSVGFDPGLNSGTLRAGRRAQGWVTFDVARGKTYSLEYKVNPLDDDTASWVVKG